MNISGMVKLALKAAAVLILIALGACSGGENRLVLHTTKGDFAFTVEIADDGKERAQGLMFRDTLASDAGMLFDYFEEQETSFWMQNTLIPLDMIFVGADGVVKNIHVNARPHDVTGIPSAGPVQFVLEIPGGRSVEIGLKPGDTMEHDRVAKPAN